MMNIGLCVDAIEEFGLSMKVREHIALNPEMDHEDADDVIWLFCDRTHGNTFFTEEKVAIILGTKTREQIKNIARYASGEEKDDEFLGEAIDMLCDIEKECDPKVSDKEAFRRVLQARA